MLTDLQHKDLLICGYPPALSPTLNSGRVAMAEAARQGAQASETGDDVIGLGHADTVRFLRINVNVENVTAEAQRLPRNREAEMNGKSIAGASPTEAFKRIRERTGLSLKALAVAAGYKGPSSLQRYEEDGAYPDGLPYRFIQKVLPVLVKEGIPEGEVLALSDLSARPSVDPSSVTKNLDDIPVSRIKSFVTALAEYSMETKTPLSPEDQGDIVATVCRWYEEQVAAGREPADVTTAHAKSFIALTLSSRPL